MAGPLSGIRIVEFAGLGPGPFACMMLADHGAEVIRIDRPGGTRGGPESDPKTDILLRSRRTIEVDLKSATGQDVLRDLVASADGLVEGFRPGVMERLGLGPEDMLTLNPKLVYGRMTGWGQTGPYAPSLVAVGEEIAAVPEPSTVVLAMMGFFALGCSGFRTALLCGTAGVSS